MFLTCKKYKKKSGLHLLKFKLFQFMGGPIRGLVSVSVNRLCRAVISSYNSTALMLEVKPLTDASAS